MEFLTNSLLKYIVLLIQVGFEEVSSLFLVAEYVIELVN